MEYAHEKKVQNDIGNACDNDDIESKFRLTCGYEEALEGVLQHEERQGEHHEDTVEGSCFKHRPFCSEKARHIFHEEDAHNSESRTDNTCKDNEQGEIAACARMVALSERFCNDRTATSADHHAYGGEDHGERQDEVHGGECGFACEVRDENTVYDGVERGEDHHEDGRERKANELARGHML